MIKFNFFIFITSLIINSGCATRNADGSCREYIPACFNNGTLVCETTDDGCKQCDCQYPNQNNVPFK